MNKARSVGQVMRLQHLALLACAVVVGQHHGYYDHRSALAGHAIGQSQSWQAPRRKAAQDDSLNGAECDFRRWQER